MRGIIFKKKKVYMMLAMIMTCTFLCGGCGNNKTGNTSRLDMHGTPQEIFNNIFEFKLPEEVSYEFFYCDGSKNFQAKINMDSKYLNEVNEGVDAFYDGPIVREEVFDYIVDKNYYSMEEFERLKSSVEWMDITYEEVDICYYQPSFGHLEPNDHRDHSVSYWTLIHKNDDNTVTMYVIVG